MIDFNSFLLGTLLGLISWTFGYLMTYIVVPRIKKRIKKNKPKNNKIRCPKCNGKKFAQINKTTLWCLNCKNEFQAII